MKVGFLGLGKLGLPVALAVDYNGHTVKGYDIDERIKTYLDNRAIPYKEEGSQKLLDTHNIEFTPLQEMVNDSEIIFVPIQTPHDSLYEGITRIPKTRKDFDYGWLKSGISQLAECINQQDEDKVVIIISTVLPGTIEREIKPLLNEKMKLCYNPFFIAMGTTIADFTNPEFVLFGVDDDWAAKTAETFYKTIHTRPFFKTDIKSAELIKVAYNTYIGMKVVFANTMMEICHHTGANVDDVTDAMGLAHERLMSKRYLYGGMGDGGGCHPRDNIAMSWLSNELGLSHNFFDNLMMARENQTEWLAHLMEDEAEKMYGNPLPTETKFVILGKTFKQETNLIVGSPSILLKNILEERGHNVLMYDPYVDNEVPNFEEYSVFLIGTKHPEFKDMELPNNSTVIDPWRYRNEQEGIDLIKLGGV
jgi:UDPglucose 6-dehydrogenase